MRRIEVVHSFVQDVKVYYDQELVQKESIISTILFIHLQITVILKPTYTMLQKMLFLIF